MTSFNVEFFIDKNNNEPAKEFLLNLDVKSRAKMESFIVLLQRNGNELREPYSKYLSDGIYELRTRVGTTSSRVLYFFYFDHRIILTNGFIKKTQKTPIEEINKAKRYRREYYQRQGK